MPNFQIDVFNQLTEKQWQAIRSVRRTWPDNIDWPGVRRAIEKAGRDHSRNQAIREERARSADYKVTLDRAELHLRRLQASLAQLEENSPSDLAGLDDPRLKRHEDWLRKLRLEYIAWSTPFRGRKNPIRDTLDDQLLTIWEKMMHGRIGSSKNKFDEPIGPLMRFLDNVLTAINGEPPGRYGIQHVIKKAKTLRRRRASKKRKRTVTARRQSRQEN